MAWPITEVNGLTERELSLWMVRGPLWPRRLELLLIQLTTVLAQVNGNRSRMGDFDIFAKARESVIDNAAYGMASLAGAGVRKLGQGRRNGK